MVAIVAIICWRIHPAVVLAGFLIFASLDGLYLSSALTKVPDGAWFTLVLTVILSGLAFVWRYGKEQQWKADLPNRTSLGELVELDEGGRLHLGSKYGGGELTNVKGESSFSFLTWGF
jgi:KUP system potassium uptake protein